MKNFVKMCGFIFLMMNSFYGVSQDDPQWYVKDGISQYPVSSITSSIKMVVGLDGVIPPEPQVSIGQNIARDDIFVIFKDYDHYNSRPNVGGGIPMGGFEYYDGSSMRMEFEKEIKYLYLTDIYDEDDPEADLTVINNPPSSNNPLSPQNIPNSIYGSSLTLSSNHDITLSNDITIVVKKDRLKALEKSTSLTFNRIEMHNGSTFNASVLDYSPSFMGQSVLGVSGADLRMDTIEFVADSIVEGYFYLNLKPLTSSIPSLLIDTTDDGENNPEAISLLPTSDEEVNYVVFELWNNGQKINELKEAIRAGHDPNKIVATTFCRDSNQNQFVKYHLEFENETSTPVKKYSAQFTLPEIFNPEWIHLINWTAGGEEVKPIVKWDGNVVTFIWNSNATPQLMYEKGIPEKGKVAVDFCLLLKDELIDHQDIWNNCIIYDGITKFDDLPPFSLLPYNSLCFPFKSCQEVVCNDCEGPAKIVPPPPPCTSVLCKVIEFVKLYWPYGLAIVALVAASVYAKRNKK